MLNVLRWSTESHHDARRVHEPERMQLPAPVMGERVLVVSKIELERSAFTAAHLRGQRARTAGGWCRTCPSWSAPTCGAATIGLRHYDGIDKVKYERGFGASTTPSSSRDRLVAAT
ncbi:MAG: hypothetical protein R2713_14575 [Ilumatobacteraceae bacterium]